jgi:predicted acetyltransferase
MNVIDGIESIEKVQFFSNIEENDFTSLISEWKKTLTFPQDDMWASFIDQSNHLKILYKNMAIGYAAVNSKNQLLQFYIKPRWMNYGPAILGQFIINQKITKAILGTNNPLALSCAMHHQKSISVHTYLFSHYNIHNYEVQNSRKINVSTANDLERLVNFYHQSTGGPKQWLNDYLSNLINRSESYFIEENKEIIGTCEVRLSDDNQAIAHIGMVVSPGHRQKGLGTFLLSKAKGRALQLNRKPICSCEKSNVGSLKAIHNNGFRSMYQMLQIEFD